MMRFIKKYLQKASAYLRLSMYEEMVSLKEQNKELRKEVVLANQENEDLSDALLDAQLERELYAIPKEPDNQPLLKPLLGVLGIDEVKVPDEVEELPVGVKVGVAIGAFVLFAIMRDVACRK